MNEREKHDEVFWNDLLEEIDLEVGDLEAAEARMSAAEDEELAPGQAEKMMRHATHGVPVLRLREPKANPFRRWLRAAVILMGSSTTLTVGTVAAATTVVVVYLVWSGGRFSRDTMSYEQQLELLAREDQPDTHRQAAMFWVAARAGRGVLALRATRSDVNAPATLADGAQVGLARIATLLAVEPPQRLRRFCPDIDGAISRLSDAELPLDVRALELERLILGIGSDIGELRSMVANPPTLSVDLQGHLSTLQKILSR